MSQIKKITAKSIKINYFYNLVYEVFAVIAPLITTPYISRVLEPEGVGIYSFTYSIAQYFVIVGNLGISISGQMKIAEARDDIYKTSKIFYELFILRFITVSASILIYLVVAFNANSYRTARIILGMFVFASVFDVSWFFRGIENFSKVVFRDVFVKVLMIVMIFTFVKTRQDVNKYILLIAASALLGNLTYLVSLKKILVKVPFKELRIFEHFKSCLVFFIPTIATSVYTILDKTMLGWLTGNTIENGYYEQAHKIEQILLIIITSLNTIMRSRMTYLYGQGKYREMKDKLADSLSLILFLSIGMSAGIIGTAKVLIPLFLGDGFLKCITLLRIFSLLLILIGISNCLNTHFLGPSGRQGKNNIVLIFGALVNALCNYIVIPQYGAIGAACASVLAELIILLGYLFLSRDFYNPIGLLAAGWRYLLAGFIMCICVMYFGNYIRIAPVIKLSLQIVAGCVIYLLIIFALKDKFLLAFIKKAKEILLKKVH